MRIGCPIRCGPRAEHSISVEPRSGRFEGLYRLQGPAHRLSGRGRVRDFSSNAPEGLRLVTSARPYQIKKIFRNVDPLPPFRGHVRFGAKRSRSRQFGAIFPPDPRTSRDLCPFSRTRARASQHKHETLARRKIRVPPLFQTTPVYDIATFRLIDTSRTADPPRGVVRSIATDERFKSIRYDDASHRHGARLGFVLTSVIEGIARFGADEHGGARLAARDIQVLRSARRAAFTAWRSIDC